jgi:AraC-like DNA-binding protein
MISGRKPDRDMPHRSSTLDDWSRAASAARDYIAAHSSDSSLGIDEVAAAASVSRRKLQRALAHDGTDYSRELRVARMHTSARLLSRRTSVSWAWRASGYRSQAHFTRTFERYYGLSPRAYLRIVALEDLLDWRDWNDRVRPVRPGSSEYFRRRKRRSENVRELQRRVRSILPNARAALTAHASSPRRVIEPHTGRHASSAW